MNSPDAYIHYLGNPYEKDADITDDLVEKALRSYDNDDKALALIESDPANEYARNILKAVLDFCDKLNVPAINIHGATLNLAEIRLYAHDAAFSDAYAEIEKRKL